MSGYINPTAKILRHADRLALWRANKTFAPIGIEIDLSNRCNLGCRDCHFGYTHSRGYLSRQNDDRYLEMGDLMSFELLKRVLREMDDCGVKSVTFTGGGEPTLHPRFVECLEAARACGLQIGLYTNATLLDIEKAEAVKRLCTWVVVSLDEVNAAKYYELKRSDGFAKACEGARMLRRANGNAVIGISFLLNWRNYNEIREMKAVGLDLGADYVEFRPTITYDENNPGKALDDTAWIDRAMPLLEEAQQSNVDVRLEQFKLYRDYSRSYRVCYGILFTGVITPNGKMWKCVNRRGYPDSCIGDLNEDGFAAIWARQKPQTDFAKCRVLCRADVINRQLWQLAQPVPHEDFI